jgi:NAD-specific glutamate dehydrogenase
MAGDGADALRLKAYCLRGKLALSDAVPALENFGFRVAAEVPTFLTDASLGSIHDFILTVPAGLDAGALLERAGLIEAALAEIVEKMKDAAFAFCDGFQIKSTLVKSVPEREAEPGEIIKGRKAYRRFTIREIDND